MSLLLKKTKTKLASELTSTTIHKGNGGVWNADHDEVVYTNLPHFIP